MAFFGCHFSASTIQLLLEQAKLSGRKGKSRIPAYKTQGKLFVDNPIVGILNNLLNVADLEVKLRGEGNRWHGVYEVVNKYEEIDKFKLDDGHKRCYGFKGNRGRHNKEPMGHNIHVDSHDVMQEDDWTVEGVTSHHITSHHITKRKPLHCIDC